MKDKPEKYGIKLYSVTDAETGYILNTKIYTGNKSEDNQYNAVHDIVEHLYSVYFNKGYTIYRYMDRFYTSPNLLDFLF